MRHNLKSIIKISAIVTIIVFIGGYSLYEARNLIRGPLLEIHTPQNGSVSNKSLTEITGVAKNISYISLNDRQITVDEEGDFKEKVLLSDGYNIIKFSVKDKFGRHVEKTLELVLKEPKEKVVLEEDESLKVN